MPGPRRRRPSGPPLAPSTAPPICRSTCAGFAAPRPLHTLIKLFALHAAVREEKTRAAFGPLSIEALAALGLVESAEGHVRPLVALEGGGGAHPGP